MTLTPLKEAFIHAGQTGIYGTLTTLAITGNPAAMHGLQGVIVGCFGGCTVFSAVLAGMHMKDAITGKSEDKATPPAP